MLKGSVAMLFGISTPNHFAHRCKRYKIRRTLQLETEVLEEAWKTGAGWLESVSGLRKHACHHHFMERQAFESVDDPSRHSERALRHLIRHLELARLSR